VNESQDHDKTALKARLVLLGASNLQRSLSTIVATAWQTWGQPIDIYTSIGSGRSYANPSRLLGRELPGISTSKMWDALEVAPPLPTYAIISDIGNDILYGIQPEKIAQWVNECLERLTRMGGQTVLICLPVDNLNELKTGRFLLFRTLWVPSCRLDLETVKNRANRLNQLVLDLGKQSSATVIQPERHWYGLDPIHIRRVSWKHAWSKVFSSFNMTVSAEQIQGSVIRWLFLQTRCPIERKWLGWQQTGIQPCGQFADGSTLSMF